MFSNVKARSLAGAGAALAMTFFFSGAAIAQGPPVNVKAGKVETAAEKKAMKAFRMKKGSGYKGDAEAKKLGDKLFKHARFNDQVQLKADKANKMMHVGRTDPSAHFRIDKTTGDFSFSKGMKGYYNDRETMGLPGKDKAEEVAKKHLTDLGLMPEKQEEMVVRHIGGLKQVDIAPDGKAQERDKLVTVHFGRQIDGIDVGGPGSKIIVQLGANGELVALHKRWIEVTEEKKADGDFGRPFDITQKITEKLKKDGAKAKKIDAGTPEFGYFDDGEGNIEPAYFFEAELSYDPAVIGLDEEPVAKEKKEHKEKYHGVVPALKNSKANFSQLERAKTPPGLDRKPDKDADPIQD